MPVRFRLLPTTARRSGSASGAAGGPLVERVVEIAGASTEIRLGRRADLELPLPFATLSGVHARVLRTDEGFSVEDAGSTNGTWLEGVRLPPGERRALVPGAELVLGDVHVRFEGEGPPAPAAEGTGTIARRLVDDLFAASPAQVPTLRVVRGARAEKLALVEPGRAYVAGRAEACALSLDVDEVSREHATFTRATMGIVVRDLGSKNGVVVAGARVAGERVLSDGDVVEIGPVTVAVDDPVGRYLRELEATPVSAALVATLARPATIEDVPATPRAPAAPAEADPRPSRPSRSVTTQATLIVAGAVLLSIVGVAAALFVSSR